eukprot:4605876-Prymnesium_polylepis.1
MYRCHVSQLASRASSADPMRPLRMGPQTLLCPPGAPQDTGPAARPETLLARPACPCSPDPRGTPLPGPTRAPAPRTHAGPCSRGLIPPWRLRNPCAHARRAGALRLSRVAAGAASPRGCCSRARRRPLTAGRRAGRRPPTVDRKLSCRWVGAHASHAAHPGPRGRGCGRPRHRCTRSDQAGVSTIRRASARSGGAGGGAARRAFFVARV